ncbi:TPA: hypothetical protein LAO86_003828 [Escherichia coli]|uniref:hypothetical protein n=1 Tax=Escherichia coli TaxID=562 RepID=UPI00106765BB|nr:hypothetical protein [Escherichia coli]TEZ27979.1 hypothetical protein BON68_17820 [Escherichia coli]TFA47814.1 hypothetical protein BON94_27050 [Escherichia coli]HBJ0720905.1 hypothetical protein [Escherichia coli]HCP0726622.1 hypothetical protein [Escherichia coli]
MKQMSLIEMDGFLKGKCIPRDLKVNETNAEYLVRKFAEAEAKCAALAAENVGMKAGAIKAIDDIQCFYDSKAWHVSEDGESETAVVALDDAKGSVEHFVLNVKTPTTDAFLAEVRAQGVEMFAECAYTLEHHDHAVAFAAELRKGGNQ